MNTDSKYFWKNSDKKNRWLQKQALVLPYLTIASLKCPQREFPSHLERNGHRFKIDFWLLYCYDFFCLFWSSSRNSMLEWIHNRIGLNHFSMGAFVFFFTYMRLYEIYYSSIKLLVLHIVIKRWSEAESFPCLKSVTTPTGLICVNFCRFLPHF